MSKAENETNRKTETEEDLPKPLFKWEKETTDRTAVWELHLGELRAAFKYGERTYRARLTCVEGNLQNIWNLASRASGVVSTDVAYFVKVMEENKSASISAQVPDLEGVITIDRFYHSPKEIEK